MLELPKALNANWTPLTWRAYVGLEGIRRAFINDGIDYINLALHTIDPDGTVHPSVTCRICGFHADVKLLGWGK
jgi:hypothetical protein